jgi:hypothetical protein
VNIDGNIIYLQGTSYENLTLAGDKFALIVMGIEKVENKPGYIFLPNNSSS